MAKRFKCPACGKISTSTGITLHFKQALSGWDRLVWNEGTEPHVKWAKAQGVKVSEGYVFNFESLKAALRRYYDSQ